jgi:large subunit ribosomal protein L10
MAKPDKAATVAEITERFRDSEAAILTEYRGLRVAEIAEVRAALRGVDAEYKVLKNTLARIAAKEVGIEDFDQMLTGPTAIVFVKGDVAAAAKALDDAAKTHPVLIVKGGVIQGRLFDADQAKALAKLEPREVQLAKIAGMMNQPAQQVVNVLSALLRNFGSMLAQVVDKKNSGELPGGDAAVAETPPDAAPGTPAEVPGEPEPSDDDEPEAPAETPEAEEQASAAPESEAAANEEVTAEADAVEEKKEEE